MSNVLFRRHDEATVMDVTKEDGRRRFRNDYFGKTSDVDVGPEGFMVNYPSHVLTRAHFHPVNQFQVLFGNGVATFKKATITRALLQYTDAYTTYGPFQSGSAPFRFFTLRGSESEGTYYMPDSREDLPDPTGKRRQFVAKLDEYLEKPLPGDRFEVDTIFEDPNATMSARFVRAAPDAVVPLEPTSVAGTYYVVLGGALLDDSGKAYDDLALGWSADRGAVSEWNSGQNGCQLLVLTF